MEYKDFKVFDNKNYSEVLSDMYNNVKDKDETITELVQSLQAMVKTPDDAFNDYTTNKRLFRSIC